MAAEPPQEASPLYTTFGLSKASNYFTQSPLTSFELLERKLRFASASL